MVEYLSSYYAFYVHFQFCVWMVLHLPVSFPFVLLSFCVVHSWFLFHFHVSLTSFPIVNKNLCAWFWVDFLYFILSLVTQLCTIDWFALNVYKYSSLLLVSKYISSIPSWVMNVVLNSDFWHLSIAQWNWASTVFLFPFLPGFAKPILYWLNCMSIKFSLPSFHLIGLNHTPLHVIG